MRRSAFSTRLKPGQGLSSILPTQIPSMLLPVDTQRSNLTKKDILWAGICGRTFANKPRGLSCCDKVEIPDHQRAWCYQQPSVYQPAGFAFLRSLIKILLISIAPNAGALREKSNDRATFTMQFDHYAPAGPNDDDPPLGRRSACVPERAEQLAQICACHACKSAPCSLAARPASILPTKLERFRGGKKS